MLKMYFISSFQSFISRLVFSMTYKPFHVTVFVATDNSLNQRFPTWGYVRNLKGYARFKLYAMLNNIYF